MLLFLLRTSSFFLLLLLLINPSIKRIELSNHKPKLSVLVDNSASIRFFNQENEVKSIISDYKNSKQLNNRFDIQFYSFGNQLQFNDQLTFNEAQTNIYEPIKRAQEIQGKNNGAVILISDGNQTIGNDYQYTPIKSSVFPIIVGDTLKYDDISITQLNVNRYSFVNNQFPIEAIVHYEGKNTVKSRFTIESQGKVIFSKAVTLSPEKKTQTITTNIQSKKEGINFYKATVNLLQDEKNVRNNSKNFSVEVIDKQSQILILSSIYHPDLGVLKKSIEKDQQRKVVIKLISQNDYVLSDYQLIVVYQPNLKFSEIFKEIYDKKINYFLITGTKTDWSFLNNLNIGIQKNSINQIEDYGASFNAGFLTFSQKDISFDQLPPLKDLFGQQKLNIVHQPLLYQNVNGFSTGAPLLATSNESNHKKVFLFGEGLWRWRSTSYLNTNSFQNFDDFIGNIIQYASSKKIRNRLDVDMKSTFNANSVIKVSAYYVDNNFEFDNRATLLFAMKNKNTGENKTYPFSLSGNSYQLELEAVENGEYEYTVSVEGQNINRKGVFKVDEYTVEEQFTRANQEKLIQLAKKTGGKAFYPTSNTSLIEELLNNNNYKTIQKSINKKEGLINFKWIMFLIVAVLSIEWFTRKYFGKI